MQLGFSNLHDSVGREFHYEPSRLRKRNAIKNACTAQARKVQWLYGELDGVRAYLHDDGVNVHVILTKRDLYP